MNPMLQVDTTSPAAVAERLRSHHRVMTILRETDEMTGRLAREGDVAVHVSCAGLEALLSGVARAMDPRDWALPGLRQTPIALARGAALSAWFGQLLARSSDPARGRQVPGAGSYKSLRVMSPSIIPGAQLPITAGVARAMKMAGRGECAVALCGEGAVASGDFHVGLNFAAMAASPAVFVVSNSGGLGTQTASAGIAIKAKAYGMPGVVVDGGDPLAVEAVIREALDRARAGAGPTLVEATCPSPNDDGPGSRKLHVVGGAENDWATRDPLRRIEAELARRGVLDELGAFDVRSARSAEVHAATEAALRLPGTPTSLLFDDVFAALTPELRRQRREWIATRALMDMDE